MIAISKSQNTNPASRRIAISAAVAALSGMLLTSDALADAITADFNDDGYEDIVIGDPKAWLGSVGYAGVVNVITNDSGGLRPGMSASSYNKKDLLYSLPLRADRFGSAVVAGDFNGDGADELAISAPNASLGTISNTGSVHVMKSSQRLSPYNAVHIYQYRPDKGNARGSALAVGDFNNDGFEDLAIGVPGRARPGQTNLDTDAPGIGAVEIHLGSRFGVSRIPSIELRRPDRAFGPPQNSEQFGFSLATGDFNGDGFDDLLVGSPFASHWNTVSGHVHSRAGMVTLFFGASSGFDLSSTIVIKDVNESDNSNDSFGMSLAAGDFNGDGYDDFAIGHPNEKVGNQYGAGAVSVFLGYRRIKATGWAIGTLWYQNKRGVPGTSERGDYFGQALASADFDNDGFDDLAIGISGEDFENSWARDDINAGAVLALFGTRNQGVVVRPSVSELYQGKNGIKGARESHDRFGARLSVGDYNSDGVADLMVGVTGESVSGQNGRGIIQVIPGGYPGFRPTAGQEQIFHRGNIQGLVGNNMGESLP